MMATFFLLFFLSTVFTLVISAICHLKEDKISFSENIYFASKNLWILTIYPSLKLESWSFLSEDLNFC